MNPSRVSYNRGMNEKGLGQDEKRGFSSCTLITSGPNPVWVSATDIQIKRWIKIIMLTNCDPPLLFLLFKASSFMQEKVFP